VVDKKTPQSSTFRFLLDGSKNIDDKSEFEESYMPLNPEYWNIVYKSKKEFYFEHNKNKSIWMTYLKPIVINNVIKAIIVVDFSLETHDMIISTLDKLDKTFIIAIIFSVLIFITIVAFSFLDRRRERQKAKLYSKLSYTNSVLNAKTKELEHKTQEVLELNKTLESRVEEEVEKNRQKDQQMIQQSRLAQMGEMISMIAHQWRQPLAAISSTSTNINIKAQLGKLDVEQVMEHRDKISEYSQHLSSTIDDFREFFKPKQREKNNNL
jgi:C4-dicarboxylate-specific signal transduction histidine kinase